MSEMNIPTKESVEKVIKESSSLVEALESVAAMYQIPAENIVVDDRAKSIRVTGDSIVTPDRPNPSANTKAIICAIGAVMDNISQRIDQKLNAYQNDQIAQNKLTANQKTPDPSKGEVVGRFYDANGEEIIAYSSGLVDSACSPAANAKVKELRDTKQIPDFVSEPDKPSNSYFTDEEDDIMKDVKTNDQIKFDIDQHQRDIAKQIGESAHFMDLIDKFEGTTTLGYDLLRSQGFDYVEATHAMIQEAVSKGHPPSSADLKHMRFDNKNLMKAISLFNAARLSFMTTTPTLKEICRNDKFKEGIKYIEKQFDCHLAIRFFDVKDDEGKEITDGYTMLMGDINQQITVSKSKGFQLHGTPIDIDFAGKILQINPANKDRELFGQSVLAIILHEIWHNISCSLRKDNDAFIFTMSSAMSLATATDNIKNRRIIISNAVNAMSDSSGKKINRLAKRKLVKQLMAAAATRFEANRIKAIETELSSTDLEDLDKLMNKMEDYVNKHDPDKQPVKKKPSKTRRKIGDVVFMIGAIMACTFVLLPLGIPFMIAGALISPGENPDKYAEEIKKWLNTTNKEEYYADLFSAMYGLPNVFSLGLSHRGITANKIDKERLQRLTDLERNIGKLMFDPHPSDEERSYASMKVAKQLLDSKEKLDPAVKKYCEWIVANYSSLEDTNLKEVFSSNIFDPKEAEDLDKHLQTIVDNNNITVTESAKISRK